MKAVVFCGHSDRRDPAWSQLMAAIFVQAVRDARGANLPQALDAVLWLSSPDAEIYLDAVGLDVDPLALLTSGRALKLAKVGFQNG